MFSTNCKSLGITLPRTLFSPLANLTLHPHPLLQLNFTSIRSTYLRSHVISKTEDNWGHVQGHTIQYKPVESSLYFFYN